MSEPRWQFCLIVMAGLLTVVGCKPKQNPAAVSPGATAPPDSAAAVAALTHGMQQIPLTSLSRRHIGTSCVVIARAPEGGTRIAPPPPPIGMVCIMGPTMVYKGEIRDLSADRIEIQAAYPTAGNMKVVALQRTEIQSVYLAR